MVSLAIQSGTSVTHERTEGIATREPMMMGVREMTDDRKKEQDWIEVEIGLIIVTDEYKKTIG